MCTYKLLIYNFIDLCQILNRSNLRLAKFINLYKLLIYLVLICRDFIVYALVMKHCIVTGFFFGVIMFALYIIYTHRVQGWLVREVSFFSSGFFGKTRFFCLTSSLFRRHFWICANLILLEMHPYFYMLKQRLLMLRSN